MDPKSRGLGYTYMTRASESLLSPDFLTEDFEGQLTSALK